MIVTGAGLFQPGTAIIGVDATDTAAIFWSTDTVNVDDGSLTINLGSSLTITTDAIDNVDNYIGSIITVEDTATLTIGLNSGADVNLNGVLNYNGNTTSSTFLLAPASGSAFNITSGVMNINGDGASMARIKLGGTLNINDALEDFRLLGGSYLAGNTNEINGGTINGPGELQIDNGKALRGYGTINAQIDGDGTAQLIAEGGLLDMNGLLEDIGRIGTSGSAAVLDMALAWNTNVASTVGLQGGRIQGATITNDGPNGIDGYGEVVAAINNNSVIQAWGGDLLINNSTNNWDGTTNTGLLRALSGGDLELRDNATFLFNGTVQANSTLTVFANGFELEFEPASTLNLYNGTYRSTSPTDIGGTVYISGTGTLQISGTANFESTSNTTLNGDLVLDNTTTRVQVRRHILRRIVADQSRWQHTGPDGWGGRGRAG